MRLNWAPIVLTAAFILTLMALHSFVEFLHSIPVTQWQAPSEGGVWIHEDPEEK